MEAANRGAQEAGGQSVGCNIQLPREQVPNSYLDRSVTCHYFFVRKVLLIQTGKIKNFPVVLIGNEYWRPLSELLGHLAAEGTISADLDLLLVTDDVAAAVAHIERYAVNQFGLTRHALRPMTRLGERRLPRAA